jgi:hypothetical protein
VPSFGTSFAQSNTSAAGEDPPETQLIIKSKAILEFADALSLAPSASHILLLSFAQALLLSWRPLRFKVVFPRFADQLEIGHCLPDLRF